MHPRLAPFVSSIRSGVGHRSESVRECLLPNGRTSLWLILNRDEFHCSRGTTSGAFIYGPDDHASAVEIEAGRVHVWVDFTPAGAGAFFPGLLPELRNAAVDLDAGWGRLRERVLETRDVAPVEEILLERLAGPGDPAIAAAAGWLESGVSVGAVTEQLGLLPRTFRRRFVAAVGLTPKRYARVRRLQRVVSAIDGREQPDWALVAAEHGYCDQSHLVDDFQDLIGATPGQYLTRRVDGPNHLSL
ncbi:MAG TPA: helix-turn-helix transcriptional regulator [Mycobacteriales bacterium]|nr:helix-turn-helix transcriptional regulator [Mycobacteriales bacterium]